MQLLIRRYFAAALAAFAMDAGAAAGLTDGAVMAVVDVMVKVAKIL